MVDRDARVALRLAKRSWLVTKLRFPRRAAEMGMGATWAGMVKVGMFCEWTGVDEGVEKRVVWLELLDGRLIWEGGRTCDGKVGCKRRGPRQI